MNLFQSMAIPQAILYPNGVRFLILGDEQRAGGGPSALFARPKTELLAIRSLPPTLERDATDSSDDSGFDTTGDYCYRPGETEAGEPGDGRQTKRILPFGKLG